MDDTHAVTSNFSHLISDKLVIGCSCVSLCILKTCKTKQRGETSIQILEKTPTAKHNMLESGRGRGSGEGSWQKIEPDLIGEAI